jgi:phospholipid-binding lipoprotein MlaA
MDPIARGYRDFMHVEIRIAIRNAFSNVMSPIKFASSLLQGDLGKSGRVLGRLIINSTLGIGGLFDVADKGFGIKSVNEDFDQALGSHGIPTGPYVVLPLLGPSTLRNMVGRFADSFLDPTVVFSPGFTESAAISVGDTINDTSFIVDDIKQLDKDALDKYESIRDFYHQYRFNLVNE